MSLHSLIKKTLLDLTTASSTKVSELFSDWLTFNYSHSGYLATGAITIELTDFVLIPSPYANTCAVCRASGIVTFFPDN